MDRSAAASFAAALVAFGCGDGGPTVRCGAGTVLVGDTCVPAPEDGGVPPGDDGGGTVDAGMDAGDAPDAGEPDRCGATDLSICLDGEQVDCATGGRAGCGGFEECHVLRWSDGVREAFCAPPGVTPCDSLTYESRCDSMVLRECLLRIDTEGRRLPGWELERDCAAMGPGASCQATPDPHCELMPCDDGSPPVCDGGGRARQCIDGRLTWWECGGSFLCASDRIADGVICIPPGATPSSTRGSLLEESIACTGPTTVRQQRGGYEWVQPCEDAVIRIDGEFVSVPTSCLARDGLVACNPGLEHRSGCEGEGWSCGAGGGATYCHAGIWEYYPCPIGCDPDTSRCVAPLACDPDAGGGECLDPAVAATCADGDGDGSGFIDRVACPGGCTETGGFSCR